MQIPSGHQGVMPYLMVERSADFLDYVTKVFDAETTHKAVNDDGALGHCEVQISGSTIMFSNTRDQWKAATANLFVYVESADETYAKAIEHGGVKVMEPADQEYGRSCGVTDPFGNVWWITSVKS